jgi:LacI family transcriptional regulator
MKANLNCTLADVGKQAGFSAATASMALRNDPRISENTRNKIQKVAQKLGYQPDPLLSALVARRDRNRPERTVANLGAIIDDRWSEDSLKGWLGIMLNGMKSISEKLGYNLEIIYMQKDLNSINGSNRILQARGIKGLVLLPPVDDNFTLNIDCDAYSIVVIGSSYLGLKRHRVGSDVYAGMQLILEKLSMQGYKNIAFAQPLASEKRLRYEWLGALVKEAYLPDSPFTIVPPYLPDIPIRKTPFLKWLKSQKPDCIITNQNEFIPWILDAGYRIPEDIGVVFLNWESAILPDPSGVAQHLDISAKSAIEQLHSTLLQGETGLPKYPKEILIRPNWKQGSTLQDLKEG